MVSALMALHLHEPQKALFCILDVFVVKKTGPPKTKSTLFLQNSSKWTCIK